MWPIGTPNADGYDLESFDGRGSSECVRIFQRKPIKAINKLSCWFRDGAFLFSQEINEFKQALNEFDRNGIFRHNCSTRVWLEATAFRSSRKRCCDCQTKELSSSSHVIERNRRILTFLFDQLCSAEQKILSEKWCISHMTYPHTTITKNKWNYQHTPQKIIIVIKVILTETRTIKNDSSEFWYCVK